MYTDSTVDPTPIDDVLTPERSIDTTDGPVTRGWVLAIDETTVDQPLEDYPLVLTPAQCGTRFTVFRSTETLKLPAGSCLQPSVDTIAVEDDDYWYTILKTALVPPSDIGDRPEPRLLTVPNRFQDGLIVESPPTSPSLWNMLTEVERTATDCTDCSEESAIEHGPDEPWFPFAST